MRWKLEHLLVPLLTGPLLATSACDMQPAEILDSPRVLALRTAPAVLAPGEPHVLSALTFDVQGELAWSLCATAWSPTEPLSCPTGAIELGRGNPLSVTLPAGLTDLWLKAEPADDSAALPAVKRLEASALTSNPEVRGLVAATGPLPAELDPGASIDLRVDLAEPAASAADRLVVSWYTSAGALDPGRTLASELATLEAPTTPGALRIIAVVREPGGGTGWTEATIMIGAPTVAVAP